MHPAKGCDKQGILYCSQKKENSGSNPAALSSKEK